MSDLSRRGFLRSSVLSGAGLFIAFHVPRKARAAAGPPAKPMPAPNAFVRIAPDESVTVLLAHSEMGQGIWTGLAMMIAEELECDWSRIRVEHAPAAPAYAHTAFGIQMTGGSSTTWSESSATVRWARWPARCWCEPRRTAGKWTPAGCAPRRAWSGTASRSSPTGSWQRLHSS